MKTVVIRILLAITFGFTAPVVCAQIDPTDSLPGDPGALTIYPVQPMSFGAFSAGNSGGTLVLSNTGSRSVTGDVVGLNMGVQYFQAIFDIDGPQGCIVSVVSGPDVNLTGSNGGTMTMHIGSSDPPSPFLITVAQPQRTSVSFGGTLTTGGSGSNPPGTYSGTFYIIFNQE